jgi:hypothetical protein
MEPAVQWRHLHAKDADRRSDPSPADGDGLDRHWLPGDVVKVGDHQPPLGSRRKGKDTRIRREGLLEGISSVNFAATVLTRPEGHQHTQGQGTPAVAQRQDA